MWWLIMCQYRQQQRCYKKKQLCLQVAPVTSAIVSALNLENKGWTNLDFLNMDFLNLDFFTQKATQVMDKDVEKAL